MFYNLLYTEGYYVNRIYICMCVCVCINNYVHTIYNCVYDLGIINKY